MQRLVLVTNLFHVSLASSFNSQTLEMQLENVCSNLVDPTNPTLSASDDDRLSFSHQMTYASCLRNEHCRRVFGFFSNDEIDETQKMLHQLSATLPQPVWWTARALQALDYTATVNHTLGANFAFHALVCDPDTRVGATQTDSALALAWGYFLSDKITSSQVNAGGSLPACSSGLPTCGTAQILQPTSLHGFQCSCSGKSRGDSFLHSNENNQCYTRGAESTSTAITTAVIAVIVLQSLMLGIALTDRLHSDRDSN